MVMLIDRVMVVEVTVKYRISRKITPPAHYRYHLHVQQTTHPVIVFHVAKMLSLPRCVTNKANTQNNTSGDTIYSRISNRRIVYTAVCVVLFGTRYVQL